MVDAAETRMNLSLEEIRPRLITLFHETWKYLLVSLVALGVDFALLVGLTEVAKMNYLASAAVGFTAGLVVNYVLSITMVFSERRLKSRGLEFLGFFVIGALGLGLNEVLMKGFVDLLGPAFALAGVPGYAWAKIPATGVGFVFNFVTRRLLLFSAAR
jgi:putative flippase GtrA